MATSSAAVLALKSHLLRSSYSKPLAVLEDVKEMLGRCYPSLSVELVQVGTDEGDSRWVIVCSANYTLVEGRPVNPARMVFDSEGTYTFEVMLKSIKSGSWKESQPPHSDICEHLNTLLSNSGYRLCPGIRNFTDEFGETVRFQPKHLRVWAHPHSRHDSEECVLWLKPSNLRLPAESGLKDTCPACRLLYRSLVAIRGRALEASPGHKEKWSDPSSNRPLKYLSPASQAKRTVKGSEQRRKARRMMLQMDDPHDIQLSADQDEELRQLIGVIQEQGEDQLEAVFEEADETGEEVGSELRQVWNRDVQARKHFFEDQLKNCSSSRGNRWSIITFRIALAIYARCPTAYSALSGFGILQLPSVSTLKSFTSFNVESAGVNEERLAHARKQYDAMVKEKKESGIPAPFYEGVLVFDEVKVGAKVHYHANTQKLIGLAMSSDELGSLHDVYQTLQPDHRAQKSSYVLQFLWRCSASNFDILGPYYTSAESMKAKFIVAAVFETIHALQIYGFETTATVCDGASTNLCAIKILSGFGPGAYGNKPVDSCADIHEIQAWFVNPFTKKKVFTFICPSQQLKNMVSALYSSREGKTKTFIFDGVTFGWFPIQDMFHREVGRARAGVPRRVPGLRESYVYRDIWTRLNVKPAKIMQQSYVLAELKEYLSGDPADAASVKLTVQYLEALSHLFEEGFLSHQQINTLSSPIFRNMEQGYTFFTKWLDSLLAEGLLATNPYQRSFLAWQTWDLMRLTWYAFVAYCRDFFERHPGYYVSPLRINGSSVETIFSQLKHGSRGTLTAVNYSSARAQLLTKRSVHGPHIQDAYRDAAVYVKESELPSRKRPKKK